jgi:hypothetical protein
MIALFTFPRTAEELARQLGGAKRVDREWLCVCPTHHRDRDPSLSITENNSKLLFTCRACSTMPVMPGSRPHCRRRLAERLAITGASKIYPSLWAKGSLR